MRFLLTLLVVMWWPVAGFAQDGDDDPGYLAGLLQNALSGAGRDVRIRGFRGALSSQASIEVLAISDADGEWLRVENVSLDWNRAALFRGIVDVTAFTAERVIVSRAPDSGPDIPSAEATPFSIPDLPVEIRIAEFAVERVELGAPLLGEAAAFEITGAAALANGGADITLDLDRIDGQQAQIALAASYDPSSRQLAVDLDAQEAEDGLIATLLGVPGAPSVALTVQGSGQIDDFTADIALATSDEPRITGQVGILAPQETGGWDLQVDINGDPTPLLTPETRPFFGTDVGLQAQVTRDASGRTEVPQFDLSANAVTLTGSAAVSETGWLEALDVEGRIANPEGGPVVLPTGGGDTRVSSVTFDAQMDGRLTFDAQITGFENPAASLDSLTLTGRGEVDAQRLSEDGSLALDVTWAAEALELADPALAEAVGTELSGAARVDYQTGQPIRVTDLQATGEDYGLTGTASWTAQDTMPLALDLRVIAERLERFSALAGRPLGGQVEVQLDGSIAPISGMVDLVIEGTTVDVTIAQDEVDRLLAGVGTARLDVRRDETGTILRAARVVTPAATMEAVGNITSDETAVQFDGVLSNLDRLYPGEADGSAVIDGALSLAGTRLRNLQITADLSNQTQPVRLPFAGGMELETGTVEILASGGPNGTWVTDIRVNDLQSPEISASRLSVAGSGTIVEEDERGLVSVDGDLRINGADLRLADARFAQAIGSDPTVTASFDWLQEAQRLTLQAFQLTSGAIDATGTAVVEQALSAPEAEIALTLIADSLEPLSGLAGRPLDGRVEVQIDGTVAPNSGAVDLVIDGTTLDVAIGQDVVDRLLDGVGSARIDVSRDATGATTLRSARVATSAVTLDASGTITEAATSLRFDGALDSLERVFPGEGDGRAMIDGAVTLAGTTLRDLQVTADLSNEGSPVRLPFGGGMRLDTGTVEITATGGADGTWDADVRVNGLQSPQVSATALTLEGNGALAQDADGGLASIGGDLRVAGTALRLADARLTQAVGAAPVATARFDWTQETERLALPAFRLDTGVLTATGSATVVQLLSAPDAQFDVSLVADSLAPLSALAGQPLRGRASIDVRGTYRDGGAFDVQANGQGSGLGINSPTVDQLLRGVTRFEARVRGDDGALEQVSAQLQNPEISARVSGPLSDLAITARLANVGLIAPDFQGALSVDGSVRQRSDGYGIDIDLDGPGGSVLAVDGRVGTGGTADLSINGTAPLGLANVFIEPRRLNGQADLDLRLSGPLAVSSLSGTITPRGAEFSAPTLGIILTPITGQIQLTNGAAQIGLSAQGNNGGSVDVAGRLGLSSLDASLTATLTRFGIRDVNLYDTSVDGAVTLTGRIGRGLVIGGDLRLNETVIQVPSSGVSALGTIPPIEHLGATRPVMRTLDRAGLSGASGATTPEARRPSTTRLDLTLTAPGRVFVRGRGLDAELAGSLRLTGPTSDIIPQGGFELVRGRLDILNQRFVLDEGRIQLSGSFNPVLRFVASTDANGITVRIILEGAASSPEITFASTPELPEDEVLAQLLFGRNLSNLSALQALELANAVATLAGRGGVGILSRLRDGFGLDDLDVSQTEEGGTAVRAGKYISDNVYSDVVVESGGRTEINLNLDVTSEITARGRVDNTGNSSVGVFFERDY